MHSTLTTAVALLALAASCAEPEARPPHDSVSPAPESAEPLDASRPALDPATWELLARAESWTIRRIDPYSRGYYDGSTDDPPSDEWFHDYPVLGTATVTERAVRAELFDVLGRGIRANDDMVAACFNPRHAISAEVDGKAVDLLICFECLQIYVYDGTGERIESALTSEFPKTVFNRVWDAQGL